MKQFFIGLALLLSLSSCRQGCPFATALSSGLASGISSTLQCKRPDLVKRDLNAIVANFDSCKPNPEGIVGMICSGIAVAAIDRIGEKIPASWECDPTLAAGGLKLAVSAACNLIPF